MSNNETTDPPRTESPSTAMRNFIASCTAIALLGAIAIGVTGAIAQGTEETTDGPILTEGRMIVDEQPAPGDSDRSSPRSIVYSLDTDFGAISNDEESVEDQFPPANASDIDDAASTALGTIRVCFDPDVPQVVRSEAMAAVHQWEQALLIKGPTVEIDFFWLNFANPNILGAAGPTSFVLDPNLPRPSARYPIALANELLGNDHAERAECDGAHKAEIVLVLNANAGSADGGWVADEVPLTSTSRPERATDLQTTILHELGHGFGFIGSAETNGDDSVVWPNGADTPLIYDLFARECREEQFSGCMHEHSAPVAVGDIGALTSEALWVETGLGPLLELEAPRRWDSGSSFSHLDEIRYPSSSPHALMTPYIERSQRIRSVDNGSAAVLQNLGWTLRQQPAPITDVTIEPHSHGLGLRLGAPDLSAGPPPTSYEIAVLRVEGNGEGVLTTVLAYQTLEGTTPTIDIQGVQNDIVYRVEVRGFGDEAAVLSGPAVPQAVPGSAALVGSTHLLLYRQEPNAGDIAIFEALSFEHGVGAALSHAFERAPVLRQQSIARLYLGYLSRLPDHQGLSYWISRLNDGDPFDDVAHDFVLSTNAERGPFTNSEFISEVYRSVLGRDVEAAGLNYWQSRLGDGTSRGQILLEISDSVEHIRKTSVLPAILVAYENYRGRLPASDELELWLSVTQERGTDELLAALALDAIPG